MSSTEKTDQQHSLIFAKNQAEAIEIYLSRKKENEETLLLSEDVTATYSKKFFVCSFTDFLTKLFSKPKNERNFYEVTFLIVSRALLIESILI